MDAALQQFDEDIKEEILRRLQGERATMSRADIEEIGVKAGLPKLRAAGEFMRLAGESWAGYIHPAKGASFWLNGPPKEPLPRWVAVDFYRWWFQNKGMLSRAPLDKTQPIRRWASTNETPLV